MKPIEFSRFVQILKGQGEAVDDLPVLTTHYESLGPAVISCWKPSLKDLLRILFRRRVYLVVLGRRCPPVSLSTDAAEVGIPETEAACEEVA